MVLRFILPWPQVDELPANLQMLAGTEEHGGFVACTEQPLAFAGRGWRNGLMCVLINATESPVGVCVC